LIITRIERQKKNKGRFSIFVDGQYYGSLVDEVFAASGFQEGREFDEGIFLKLKNRDEARVAFDQALRFLEKRARSEHEVREKLKSRDFSDEAVESAVEKLKGYRYIDDSQFAGMLLSDEINIKLGSRRSAMMRLKKSGVGEEAALAALEGYSDEDERENALMWAKKLTNRYQSEDDGNKKKQKIAAAMARRGFGWETIRKAIEEAAGGNIEE